ncbi:hypothetical protein [Mycobacterium sp. EPa45]|uniref:hypothetical protein n=1 Tax=Mycobacterium sp. EPa45 TaxID=1545728 RepID=UPI000642090E|nr:hypothetical protein [Mycobacterium sp. EPa45]AKK28703.1 hypothetical protein AB431_20780 [Mycobacterium sp. EPa45]
MTAPAQQYYDQKGVTRLARERGLSHITENSVINAAYRDGRLKRTKIQGRIYYKIEDIEAWLTGERPDD